MGDAGSVNDFAPVSDLGDSRGEVEVIVKVDERVKIHHVNPAQSPATSFASNSPNGKTTGTLGLRAWLAASKVWVPRHVRDLRSTVVRLISRCEEY